MAGVTLFVVSNGVPTHSRLSRHCGAVAACCLGSFSLFGCPPTRPLHIFWPHPFQHQFDMAGAAAVLGAARALAETRPPVEVHVVMAACENLISDTAMRPGDIVTASNGQTIEVANTDAGMWRLEAGGRGGLLLRPSTGVHVGRCVLRAFPYRPAVRPLRACSGVAAGKASGQPWRLDVLCWRWWMRASRAGCTARLLRAADN